MLITARVVFGMSKAQVLRRLGPPAKKRGACWQYREGVTLHERHTIEAERLCFVSGRYSYTYPEIDGRWRLPGT